MFIEFMKMDAVRQARTRYPKTGHDKGFDPYWTINIQIRLLFIGLEGPAREETWQTKNMVPM